MPRTRRSAATGRAARRRWPPSTTQLDELVEQAIVDAYDESEQAAGWHAVLEDQFALPFETTVLGTEVKVVELEFRNHNSIVAICVHGRERQAIPLLDVPLPSPKPEEAEWVEAYRRWLGG